MTNRHLSVVLLVALTSFAVQPFAIAEDKNKKKKGPSQEELLQQWKLQQAQSNQAAAAQLAAKRAAALQLQQQQQQQPAQNPFGTANNPGNSAVTVQVLNNTGAVVQTALVLPNGSQQRNGDIQPTNVPATLTALPGTRWLFAVGGQIVKDYTVASAPAQQIILGNGGNPAGTTSSNPKKNRNANGNTNGNVINNPAPDNAQVQAFLQVHNGARAAVGVAPLSWSNDLAQYAQQWANHLASLPTSQVQAAPHRPNQIGGRGENFAGGSGGAYSPATAAQQWLAEKNGYRYGPFNGSAGHYTQMVWRGTTQVGYGIARSADGWTYVVANYSPGGNFFNQPPY